MSKYTKAERHEIYKKALKTFIDNGVGGAICYHIKRQTDYYGVKESDFPELYLFYRTSLDSPHNVWIGFDEADKKERFDWRKTVLMFCVAMTRS